MYTCGYCGTSVQLQSNNLAHCSFCDMDLFKEDIAENGKRRTVNVRKAVLLFDAKRSTGYLMEQSAFFLIKLLKLVRAERKRLYEMMRLFRKGVEAGGGFSDEQRIVSEDYEFYSRKAWVIENILRDKSDVYPPRITDQLLEDHLLLIEKQGADRMEFRLPNAGAGSRSK